MRRTQCEAPAYGVGDGEESPGGVDPGPVFWAGWEVIYLLLQRSRGYFRWIGREFLQSFSTEFKFLPGHLPFQFRQRRLALLNSLNHRKAEPFVGLSVIARNVLPRCIDDSQIMLGHGIALLGRKSQPSHGLGHILYHPLSIQVAVTESALSICEPLLGSSPKPIRRLGGVAAPPRLIEVYH